MNHYTSHSKFAQAIKWEVVYYNSDNELMLNNNNTLLVNQEEGPHAHTHTIINTDQATHKYLLFCMSIIYNSPLANF